MCQDFLPPFFYEISQSGSGSNQGAGVMESRVLTDKLESQNHCSSYLFLPSIYHQILDVIFPDFLRHKATSQLVRQSLLPAISQLWDKVKIKNKIILKGLSPPQRGISGAAACCPGSGGGGQSLVSADSSSAPIWGQERAAKRDQRHLCALKHHKGTKHHF